jgi:hypothetical protein
VGEMWPVSATVKWLLDKMINALPYQHLTQGESGL